MRASRILLWSLALSGWMLAAVLIALRWHPAPAAPSAVPQRVLCPVCHAVVDPATAPHATYRGVTYFFCPASQAGRNHKELFLAWPEHYLSGQPMPAVGAPFPSPEAASAAPLPAPTAAHSALPAPPGTPPAPQIRATPSPGPQAAATASTASAAKAGTPVGAESLLRVLPTMQPAADTRLDPK
jgi:YHS domain-containing protein